MVMAVTSQWFTQHIAQSLSFLYCTMGTTLSFFFLLTRNNFYYYSHQFACCHLGPLSNSLKLEKRWESTSSPTLISSVRVTLPVSIAVSIFPQVPPQQFRPSRSRKSRIFGRSEVKTALIFGIRVDPHPAVDGPPQRPPSPLGPALLAELLHHNVDMWRRQPGIKDKTIPHVLCRNSICYVAANRRIEVPESDGGGSSRFQDRQYLFE